MKRDNIVALLKYAEAAGRRLGRRVEAEFHNLFKKPCQVGHVGQLLDRKWK